MVKTITKIGNSQGIIFDSALLDLTHLRVGDQVDVTITPESGAITLMPIRKGPTREEIQATIAKTVKDYRTTLKKLS